MLSYQRLKDHPRALRAFTGLDQAEFEKLLRHFDMAYHAYRYDQHVTKKFRKRRYGAGRKPRLAPLEEKLRFILFYFKIGSSTSKDTVGEFVGVIFQHHEPMSVDRHIVGSRNFKSPSPKRILRPF